MIDRSSQNSYNVKTRLVSLWYEKKFFWGFETCKLVKARLGVIQIIRDTLDG